MNDYMGACVIHGKEGGKGFLCNRERNEDEGLRGAELEEMESKFYEDNYLVIKG